MMATPPWLERLRVQVQRQGLPTLYAERLLDELGEHYRDIQEEKGMDAENFRTPEDRMGEPVDLARAIGGEYRRRHLSRRHPFVMFALMPVLMLLGIWAGMILLAFIAEGVLGGEAGSAPGAWFEPLLDCGVILLPVALTAVIFCRAATTSGADRRWPLVTGAMLAIFPGLTVMLAPSTLYIGLLPMFSAVTLLRALMPLSIGGWYTLSRHRLRSF